jgi:protein-disulfide isomerase
MKNKIFVLSAVAIGILAFVVLGFLNPVKPKPEPLAPVAADLSSHFVRVHSPSFGNSLSKVTVVQWFDPECESCRAIHPDVTKIVSDYSERVHFVLRYMPYHGGSMFAASALEEARELGKFDEALNLLFEKQPEWGDHHAPRPELIPTYLATLGISKDKLDRDYLLKKHSEKIRIDEADGKIVGLTGTPTFFVNGQMVAQLGDRPLREAIDAALNGAK